MRSRLLLKSSLSGSARGRAQPAAWMAVPADRLDSSAGVVARSFVGSAPAWMATVDLREPVARKHRTWPTMIGLTLLAGVVLVVGLSLVMTVLTLGWHSRAWHDPSNAGDLRGASADAAVVPDAERLGHSASVHQNP